MVKCLNGVKLDVLIYQLVYLEAIRRLAGDFHFCRDLTGSNPKAVISSSAALALAAATLAHFRDRDANANRRQIRLDVASVYVPTPLIQQTVPND
jgi:hypothetical protein